MLRKLLLSLALAIGLATPALAQTVTQQTPTHADARVIVSARLDGKPNVLIRRSGTSRKN